MSLADQHYFTADAVNRVSREKRYYMLRWVARVLLFALFILLAIAIRQYSKAFPIELPTDSAVLVVGVSIVITVLLRYLFAAIETAVTVIMLELLDAGHRTSEKLRFALIRAGMRPRGIDWFKARLDNCLKVGKSAVFRLADDGWQEAVIYAIKNVDAAAIDVSDLSENVMWEVDTVFRYMQTGSIRIIANREVMKDEARVEDINRLMSDHFLRAPLNVTFYDYNSDWDFEAWRLMSYILDRDDHSSRHEFPLVYSPPPLTEQAPDTEQDATDRRRRRRQR